MSRVFWHGSLLAASLLTTVATTLANAEDQAGRASFEPLLQQGKLADAERAIGEALRAKPEDDDARLALGVVQFLRAVEGRMQAFYRHGYRSEPGMISFTNLPIPKNPKPEPLDYKAARKLLQTWIDDLERVETTLAKVNSTEVRLPLHFGLIRLDFDGDGRADEDETLWKVYGRFNRGANASAEAARFFIIAFDRGDVDWLRGYCHVLSALTETLLAHDFEDLFNRSGFLLFEGIKAPVAFLVESKQPQNGFDVGQILDLVAMFHLIRLPVAEPERLKSALAHMEAMVALSRSSWKFILAETDDDREWVPNPKQSTVIPNVRVTAEMVEGWKGFLDEFESILAGKKLAPFWRGEAAEAWDQRPPHPDRAPHLRPHPLGPGQCRRPLPGAGRDQFDRDVEPPQSGLRGGIHRVRHVVQLRRYVAPSGAFSTMAIHSRIRRHPLQFRPSMGRDARWIVNLELPGIAARPSFEDRYELRAKLWLDGPHAGYLALDRVLGRDVVVNVAYRARDSDAVIEKARTLARLRHANILPIFDLGVTGEGLPFFTRPEIRLVPMDNMVRRLDCGGTSPNRDFPLKPLVTAVRDACLAVSYARGRGFYHDDLYPGTILVGGGFREVFVADGWASIRREAGHEPANPDPSGFRCRPDYVDPERARDLRESHDPQDDVFAFGGILYLILYGKPPNHLPGVSNAGKRLLAIACGAFEPRKPGKLRAGIRSQGWWKVPTIRNLGRICLRALDSNLDRRQRDVEELTRELDQWLDGR
jgi:hypothetical protein